MNFKLHSFCSCKSHVGRSGGPQLVTITPNCSSVCNVAHVLGHALGLWHEHSRPDRDEYIEVHLDRIAENDTLEINKLYSCDGKSDLSIS